MKEKVSFEDQIKQLAKIIEELKRSDLTLEKSIELYEEGIKISKNCAKELTKAEGKLLELENDKEVELNKSSI